MIDCIPRGICSWNFDLVGEGHRGAIEFEWISEQGALQIDGETRRVRKHGMLSGRWSLDRGDEERIVAQKASAFSRTFELTDPLGSLKLRAMSAFGRTFVLQRGSERIATIAPKHPLTRRATITTQQPDTDVATLAFAFWLTVLTWRRAASSQS